MFSMFHSQVMQSTGNLHGLIGQLGFFVPKHVFDHATALHPGEGMLHAHAQLRQLAVGVLLGDSQLAPPWLFFSPGRSSAPLAHTLETLCLYTG